MLSAPQTVFAGVTPGSTASVTAADGLWAKQFMAASLFFSACGMLPPEALPSGIRVMIAAG